MAKKKYGLHCFGCGYLFCNKKDVCRIEGMPYCGECEGNYYQNLAEVEYDNGYDEQEAIDQANIARYGEC